MMASVDRQAGEGVTMSEMDRILAEIQKTHPPMTAAEHAAWQRAYNEMEAKYPGQYVAYIETRDGGDFAREVVAASADLDDYMAQFDRLPPEVRARAVGTSTRAPGQDLFIMGQWYTVVEKEYVVPWTDPAVRAPGDEAGVRPGPGGTDGDRRAAG